MMMNSGCQTLDEKLKFLKEEMKKRTNCSESSMCDLNERVNAFFYDFKSRWNKVHRVDTRFMAANRNWLESSIGFSRAQTGKRGRKEISFTESSESSKHKRTKLLRDTTALPVLAHATQIKLRTSGYIEESKMLRGFTNVSLSKNTPSAASSKQPLASEKMSNVKALSVFVEANLSSTPIQYY